MIPKTIYKQGELVMYQWDVYKIYLMNIDLSPKYISIDPHYHWAAYLHKKFKLTKLVKSLLWEW
jgi:hypothetical protein